MYTGSSELPYLAICHDFITQSAVLRNLKKGPKRVPELEFEPHNALLQAGSNGLDFDGFPSAFEAKPGRNPILVMACFLDKINRLQKHTYIWKRIPQGVAENILK